MKWIKTYEAAANKYRNEKLKRLKSLTNSLLPTEKQVNTIINNNILTEDYNLFCDSYLIPRFNIGNNIQRKVWLNTNDTYKGYINFNGNSGALHYGSNYAGMTRLLNDYYSEEVSTPIFNEKTRKVDGVETTIQPLVIEPILRIEMEIFLKEVPKCVISFGYQLNWASKAPLNSVSDSVSISKENLSRKDIIDFFEEQSKLFYIKLIEETNKFKNNFKNSYLNTIRDIVANSGSPTLKQTQVLQHYPFLIKILGLDLENINTGAKLKEGGFDD